MFEHRSTQSEIMDELTLGGEDMAQTLRELRFINHWLGGNAVTLRGLDRLLGTAGSSVPPGPLRIADLGCGGGDMLERMAGWARKRQLAARFTGIDANEYIISYAKDNTARFPEIEYRCEDIFSAQFAAQAYDIVTCTLFCHHFRDQELVQLFRQLKAQARVGLVINDLHRHWLAYHSIGWLTRWFSKSYLVKNDAKLSVWRAFRRRELAAILAEAGWRNVSIRWAWAFRWQVVAWQ
ncbi:MAG: methyltransferase domain-containing protein [Cytophagales bacterium]|nr:methyltransferase domain-containing protein [Cytophagales bacterium]